MFCTVRQAGDAANNGSWGWNFTKAFFGGLVSSAGWKSVYHSIVDEGGCDKLMSSTFADVFNPLPGDGVGASDACPIGGCDPPLDPDHPRHDPKEPPQKPANKAAPLILKAQSDCPTANGREIDYTLQDANGNPVSDYTVVEHQTDTSRASSAFGPGTSFETAPPGTGSGFQDTLNPGPYQKPGNSIQTFTVTTAKPSPSAPQQPVMIQSVNGQMNGSLGIWFQFPQVFVNGVPTPTQCVFGR